VGLYALSEAQLHPGLAVWALVMTPFRAAVMRARHRCLHPLSHGAVVANGELAHARHKPPLPRVNRRCCMDAWTCKLRDVDPLLQKIHFPFVAVVGRHACCAICPGS
jgi:hypothetical protein